MFNDFFGDKFRLCPRVISLIIPTGTGNVSTKELMQNTYCGTTVSATDTCTT